MFLDLLLLGCSGRRARYVLDVGHAKVIRPTGLRRILDPLVPGGIFEGDKRLSTAPDAPMREDICYNVPVVSLPDELPTTILMHSSLGALTKRPLKDQPTGNGQKESRRLCWFGVSMLSPATASIN